MKRSVDQLRRDVERIWRAGLEAVRSDRLVAGACASTARCSGSKTSRSIWRAFGRIVVVGAGKAGAGMAAGFEQALGRQWLATKQVAGWINVPADCLRPLERLHLHPARPAGVNEPTVEGVDGTGEILRLVESLAPQDVCFVLLSGGGSALLPAPADGITLADKLTVTRRLSAAGANITELNTVRKWLSRIKGGGLARACRAGRLFTLIISDVLGDPLDVIASGPTVIDRSTPAEALAVLERFAQGEPWPAAVLRTLRGQPPVQPRPTCRGDERRDRQQRPGRRRRGTRGRAAGLLARDDRGAGT